MSRTSHGTILFALFALFALFFLVACGPAVEEEPTQPQQQQPDEPEFIELVNPEEPQDEAVAPPESFDIPRDVEVAATAPWRWVLYAADKTEVDLAVVPTYRTGAPLKQPEAGTAYPDAPCFTPVADKTGPLAPGLSYELTTGEPCSREYPEGAAYYLSPVCDGPLLVRATEPHRVGQELVYGYGEPANTVDGLYSLVSETGECMQVLPRGSFWYATPVSDEMKARFIDGAPYKLVWE